MMKMPVEMGLEIERIYELNKDGTVSFAGFGVRIDDFYFEYDELGQLVKVRLDNASGEVVEEYTYDGTGERIKSYNAVTNTTVYTPFKEFMQIQNSSGIFNYTYVYENDVLVARVNPDGSKYFYHPDHLGSTSLITNETGAVVEDVWYYPYGSLGVNTSERRLYEGQEYSSEIGEYDYNFRNYKPDARIFLKADSILPDIYDPQQLNRYAFERGNPYSYTDPAGNAVIYFGGLATGGSGFGVSTSTGFVLSIDVSQGIQFGTYQKYGGGVVTPTASGGLEFGVAPFQKNIGEFSGGTYDAGGNIGEGVALGIGLSVPKDDSGVHPFKFAFEGTLSGVVNPPPFASGYVTGSETKVNKFNLEKLGRSFVNTINSINSYFKQETTEKEAVL